MLEIRTSFRLISYWKRLQWVKGFVYWYNNEHRHSRIKFVTPNQRHEGLDIEILEKRKELYQQKKTNIQNDGLEMPETGNMKRLWS